MVQKNSILLKGTASAVPKMSHLQRGFSRWGTLFPRSTPS